MKAFVVRQYGSPDVLELSEVSAPVPRDNEVLIEVQATSINAFDWRHLVADPFLVRLSGGGLLRPARQIPGVDVAGRVANVGRDVTSLREGDRVFGDLSGQHSGAFAEYVTAAETSLALMPAGMSFREAAVTPMAGVAALQALRNAGEIAPGQHILVNGASGGVGTFAVQIAKLFQAQVTAICSERNRDLVQSIGADEVLDYSGVNFNIGESRYDLILAVNGYQSILRYRKSMKPGGSYVMCGGKNAQIFQGLFFGPLLSSLGKKTFRSFSASPNQQDLLTVGEWVAQNKITPVIDRACSFDEIPEALRYLGKGHTRGKVVVLVRT